MNALVIRPLQTAEEARGCAKFLAASDPWRTLGLTAEQILQRLAGSGRETHVATVENQIAGVLVLQLAGPLILRSFIDTATGRGTLTTLTHIAALYLAVAAVMQVVRVAEALVARNRSDPTLQS